tara:strand:- start:4227 stop:4550 length:324 start_codon:yes stop_codon:yes gene_type:complete
MPVSWSDKGEAEEWTIGSVVVTCIEPSVPVVHSVAKAVYASVLHDAKQQGIANLVTGSSVLLNVSVDSELAEQGATDIDPDKLVLHVNFVDCLLKVSGPSGKCATTC